MDKKSPEVLSLRYDIEKEVKRRIMTPYDFEFLAGVIWERLHEKVSAQTLKRIWGYLDGADSTRRSTLSLLARFLGYSDWDEYVYALSSRSDVESKTFVGEGLHIDDLKAGDKVEVTWLPNRHCVFRYEGEAHFTVLVSENAKLQVGDTFETAHFLVGVPMYIDRLARGSEPPTAYVAGAKNGLNSVKIIEHADNDNK